MAGTRQINQQGGFVPANRAELKRARETDLGTMPRDIAGTNCGNCSFIQPEGRAHGIQWGFCANPKVLQPVTDRQCCCYWDNPGYLRP